MTCIFWNYRRIYKELVPIGNRKLNNPIKEFTSQKNIYEWAITTGKGAQHH